MKKLLGIILVSLLCFNFSIADENKELRLIEDYKNRLFDNAIKQDLKKVEEICSNYKSDKEKNIILDKKNKLKWLCSGGLKPIFTDITYEYNKKLIDKILPAIDICNEYKKIPLDAGEYSQMSLNIHLGIMNYCETVELRQNFKQEAKHNLIKDLDLEKLNFNFLSNKYYSLSIPEKDITKKTSCFLNLKKEKSLDYKDIKERCGVKSVTYQEESPSGSKGELASYELISERDLTSNWIVILDYFYADANEDDYMDLVIRFKNDGSYSMAAQTMTTIVTALSKNKYENTNYSE